MIVAFALKCVLTIKDNLTLDWGLIMANESISDVKAQAVEFFRSGFNCAESVSRAVLAYFKIDSEPICGAAAGFGGGLGRYGNICGAISGGVLAIGAISSQGCRDPKDRDKISEIYQKTFQLIEAIEVAFGSPICHVLTGCDLRTEEGRKKFSEQNIRENVCEQVLGRCIEKTIELLK